MFKTIVSQFYVNASPRFVTLLLKSVPPGRCTSLNPGSGGTWRVDYPNGLHNNMRKENDVEILKVSLGADSKKSSL